LALACAPVLAAEKEKKEGAPMATEKEKGAPMATEKEKGAPMASEKKGAAGAEGAGKGRDWSQIDKNNDNAIQPDEMEAWLKANPGPLAKTK
jgi:hypothetical protein